MAIVSTSPRRFEFISHLVSLVQCTVSKCAFYSLLLSIVQVSISLSAADHQPPTGYAPLEQATVLPLNSDLTTTLEVPVGPFLIGSPLVIHYTIHNNGLSLFNWIAGGDGRGVRPSRIWLEAVDETGAFASDPLSTNWELGSDGVVSPIAVDPLGRSYISVYPYEFLRLDRPGRWTLRLFHDLGMGPKPIDKDPRWASATIELVLPTQKQTEEVLRQHLAALGNKLTSTGQRLPVQADFSAMNIPLYLPVLMQHANLGSVYAINGLGQIPDPVAIDHLIALLEQDPLPFLADEKDSVQGTQPWATIFTVLNKRFSPIPTATNATPSGDPRLIATMDAVRAQRVMNAAFIYSGHHDKRVRDSAAILLLHGSVDEKALLPMIEAAIKNGCHGLQFNLLLSGHARVDASIPDPTSSNAASAIWMHHLKQHPAYRPDNWQALLPTMLKHDSPRLRTLALTLIPDQLSTQWTSAIIKSLFTSDWDEKTAAIAAASRCRDPAFIPVLRSFLTDRKSCSLAASSLGIITDRYSLCLMWLDLLATAKAEDEARHALSWFYRTVSIRGSGSGADPAFFAAWKSADLSQQLKLLIKDHQQIINAKKDDTFIANWPSTVMPKKWALLLSDGSLWPTSVIKKSK